MIVMLSRELVGAPPSTRGLLYAMIAVPAIYLLSPVGPLKTFIDARETDVTVTYLPPSHIRDDNCRLTPVSPVISITACSFGRPNPPSTRDATGVTMADYPQEHVSLFWPVQRENYNGTHSNK